MIHFQMRSVSIAALFAATALQSIQAHAAENFNVRANGGILGRELFVPVAPGHYASGTVAYSVADKLLGNDGNDFSQTQRVGAFNVPLGIKFKQTQKNINFRYLYVLDEDYLGAKLGLTAALGYVEKSRDIGLTPRYPTPGPGPGARNPFEAGLRAREAQENVTRGGLTDAEVGAVMSWEFEASKIIATMAVTVPTGSYDATRALNAGNGKFYTYKPSIGYGYVFDSGVQLGGRLLYGTNTRNKDTSYKSGDFIVVDAIAMYKFGPVNMGFNLYQTQQLSSDQGPAVAAHGNKLKNTGVGLTASMPTGIGGLEIKYNNDLSGRNTRQAKSLSVRLSHAF